MAFTTRGGAGPTPHYLDQISLAKIVQIREQLLKAQAAGPLMIESRSRSLSVALGQYDIGWHDPDTSLARAARIAAASASRGARLVVLPEMCTSGFTMDAQRFAEPLDGPLAHRLSEIARSNSVWLIAGMATRVSNAANDGTARNSALVFEPSGALAAVYHKQRLFTFAAEQASYSSGETDVVVEIDGVRVAPFICYDLRFPELFRSVAPRVDLIVVIASWPSERRTHWDVLLRARAIENQCYVAGVNRTGTGRSVAYDGGSVVFDPWGTVVGGVPIPDTDGVTAVPILAEEVARVRSAYPFLADRGAS